MKITQGPLEWISARYLYKDLRTKIPRTSSRKNLLTRSSTRFSSQGSPSALFARTCTRSCKDLLKGFQLYLCKVSREIFCLKFLDYILYQTCCPTVLEEGERIHHGRPSGGPGSRILNASRIDVFCFFLFFCIFFCNCNHGTKHEKKHGYKRKSMRKSTRQSTRKSTKKSTATREKA